MTLGHPASEMGDELRREVERQLLEDLAHYRAGEPGERLAVDWSDPVQEGHRTEALGGTLESMSQILVRRADGTLVAEGWLDFVRGDYYDRYRDRAHFGIDLSAGIRYWFK